MSFVIGSEPYSNSKVVLKPKDIETHMHVIGASGAGKSYFLEHIIRQKISKGHGVCLIDPHGEMYDNLVTWMSASGYMTNEVHLINPSKSEFSVGFNPLAIDRNPSRCVVDMIEAIARVWGGGDTSDTPRLKKCLRAALYALAHHRLSLFEADIFTSTRHKDVRRRLLADLPIEEYQNEWAELETYSDREFREYFESTRSRLFEFLTAPAIKPIIGQTKNVLDFSTCMEKGHVVLVNLAESASFHKKEAQLLGALITGELYSCAKQRDVKWASSRPFYAVIDECAAFINNDIAASLDETRKFGLHFVLSHQRLQQLKEVSDNCYDAVMANAQAKVVFKINDDETAQVLCAQLFRTEFDLERPKDILNKPVAVGQEVIRLFSESETESFSESETTSQSFGYTENSSNSKTTGESQFSPDEGDSSGTTESSNETEASGNSYSENSSETSSSTSGYSWTKGSAE